MKTPSMRGIAQALVLCIVLWLLPACTTATATARPTTPTATATAMPTPTATPISKNTKLVIMPLGDSITAGIGSSTGAGYRLPLWNDLVSEGVHVQYVGSQQSGPATFDQANEGHSGSCIDYIAASIVGWLQTYRPQVILLQIGTNDILHDHDPSDPLCDGAAGAPAHLSALIDQITATTPSATLIVAQVTPLGDPTLNAEIKTYNAAIPGIVQADASRGKHVQYVDMYDAVPLAQVPGGVHPNDQGYALMATVWNKTIMSLYGS